MLPFLGNFIIHNKIEMCIVHIKPSDMMVLCNKHLQSPRKHKTRMQYQPSPPRFDHFSLSTASSIAGLSVRRIYMNFDYGYCIDARANSNQQRKQQQHQHRRHLATYHDPLANTFASNVAFAMKST